MAFLAVAIGAFGAHGLKDSLTDYQLDIFRTGVQYHMMHALGIILIGALMDHSHHSSTNRHRLAALIMLVGIILFSGSLYTLSITGIRWLGMITPIGGVCFLAAWLLLCISHLFPGRT